MNHNQGRGGQPHGQRGQGQNSQQQPQRGPNQDWQQPPPRQKKRDSRSAGAAAVAHADAEERKGFIRRTYTHLMIAIFTCVALMALFINSPFAPDIIEFMTGGGYNWLIVLALFIGFSWLGDMMAHRVDSKGLQYIGLVVGVGAYAIILTPLVLLATAYSGPGLLVNALLLTGLVFAALTAVVFMTGKDFSVLRTGLVVASVLALGAIVAGVLFGFSLGLGFAIFMVGLCAGMIVYQTSNILHHYRPDQHVGAALGLFSSIGMLFYYVLWILMSMEG